MKMAQMASALSPPDRRPESSKFYAREVIPAELRFLFGGKWEVKASLGASDPAETQRFHTDALVRFEARSATARARHRGEARNLTPRTVDAPRGVRWVAEAAKYAATLAQRPGKASTPATAPAPA